MIAVRPIRPGQDSDPGSQMQWPPLPPSLRNHLLGLLVLVLVPTLALGAVAAAHVMRNYQQAVKDGLQDTARALAVAVDRDIEGRLSTLAALAASPRLDGGTAHLDDFAQHARRAAAAIGAAITVIDPDFRLVFHTDLAPGEVLPPTGATEAVRTALATRRPAVSSLLTGVVSGVPVVLVIMPVVRDGTVRMLLAARLAPERLARLLAGQAPSDGGTTAVFDGNRRVVARSTGQADWVGREAPDWLAAALAGGEQGVVTGSTDERGRLLVAYHRLALAPGWAVTVAEPTAVHSPVRTDPALGLALGGLSIFGLGLVAVGGLHRRVVRPIEALTRRAEALVTPGAPAVNPDPAGVAEFERLRRSLLEAEAALQARAAAEARSRNALAESERRYRRLAETGNMVLWRADPEGRLVHSHGWWLLTGQPAEAARGDGWLAMLHAEDAPAMRAIWRAAVAARQPASVECRVRTRLGTLLWVRVRAVPIFDADHDLVEWAGVVEDVDARRRAEQVTRDLLATLDLAAVLERGPDGRIRFWSAGCERLYGWTAAEAIGAPVRDLLRPVFPGPAAAIDEALARTGEWSGELLHHTRTGEERIILCRMVRRPGAEDRPETVLEALMDMTALRRTERALHESESRVLRALDAARIGAWEWDLATDRLTGSPGREEVLLGRPTGFLRYRADALALMHPADRQQVVEAMERIQTGASATLDVEFRIMHSDGGIRWLRSVGRATLGPEGAPQRVSGVSIDVTDQRAARQREVLLAREVDHRAKNALAVVQSVLRLTSMEEPRAYAAAVGARVSALSRAHSLLAREGWAGADLRALIEREVTSQASTSEAVTLDGPELRLAAIAVQPVAMVLHELARNAAQHGPLSRDGGRLRIAWRVGRREWEDGMLRLCWQETGGPAPAAPPAHRGFGLRVIEATIRSQLGGSLEMRWTGTGLDCEIALALARWSAEDADGAQAA
ncbi:PAS domain-containing protein [Paracraurococcus lichenis]|uniref:histidine kinase n=1 Tax=Paracraurococcus lichenis TaxID=3064888 RepID=A0ABT9E112_9PROT|nr:PAS domain-containing protein [Paracraurococcus sp. LOR1-02]MDO9709852.1 PAS domain-containing protein [Paracraurococcus sp. LOR1-02]